MVKTGSSYLSQSELPVTFGLGSATKVAKVEVAWPSGKTDQVAGVAGDRTIVIKEGQGVVPDASTAGKTGRD
jgi:hypothetical protein